jgi:hypothetical protein
MNRPPIRRRGIFALLTTAFLLLALPGHEAAAQQKITKAQLVGTWTLVSNVNVLPNGTRISPYTEKGTGMAMLDASGHFSWQLFRPDIPKMASNNRTEGTADEFKAVALGTLSYFGTYSFDAKSQTLTMHIQASSFANFNGTDQKRTLTLKGDELTVTNATGASGGTAIVIWKRAR